MMGSTKVSVIIVTHNSELHIDKLMKSLVMQTRQADQIIFIDTGSSNPSYLFSYRNKKTIIIIGEKGIGFCRGNNLGWAKLSANTDYVFFLNPDAFPEPQFVEQAVEFMERPSNNECGAVTGTVLGYNIGTDSPTGKYDTTGIFRKWYGKYYDRDQGTIYHKKKYTAPEEIPAICGAVLFCRKKALDQVLIRGKEVFDNSFYMYKEDIDLSLRLQKKKWKLYFVPDLICYHCRGWNSDRSKMARKLRLCSSKNELRIQYRKKTLFGILYSSLKHVAVVILDL